MRNIWKITHHLLVCLNLKIEIMEVMLAIELVVVKGQSSIWLEIDFILVVEAFKKYDKASQTSRER